MQELEKGITGLKPPAADNSVFSPVFRSGSYSEKGPKQYMEDEFICVDNLLEHLPSSSNFPSPASFYGVLSSFSVEMLGYYG